MRYFHSSKSRQISASVAVSILLHTLIFAAVYYARPLSLNRTEAQPISVDYLNMPSGSERAERSSPASSIKGEVPKLKSGKPVPVLAKPQPAATPPPESPPPAVTQDASAATEPHPLETPKAESYPSIKDLTPSLDKLSKTEGGQASAEGQEEGGEGGKDEETVSLESTNINYESYLHGVKFKIEGVWRYPESAKKSALQGRGLVSFVIERDGAVGELKLLSSSGYPVLDEAILKAIREAAPFNPMLGNMRVKRLKIVAGFEYNLAVQRIWGQ